MRNNIIGFFQFLRLVMVIVSISIVHVPTAKAESCKATFEILPPVLGGPCPNPLSKEQNVIVTWPGKTEAVTLKGTGSCCDVCEDCKPAPIAYCFDQKSKGVWPSFGVPVSDDDGNVTMEVKDMVCSVSDTDCTLDVTPPLSPITIPVPGKTHTMSGQEGADRTETRSSPCSTPPSNPPGGGGGSSGYVSHLTTTLLILMTVITTIPSVTIWEVAMAVMQGAGNYQSPRYKYPCKFF